MPENTLLNSIEKRVILSRIILHGSRKPDNIPPMLMPIHVFLMSLNEQVYSVVKSISKELDLGLKKLHKGEESYKGISCKKRPK